MHIEDWKAGTLNERQLLQLAELHLTSFDPRGRTPAAYVEQRLRAKWLEGRGRDAATSLMHVVLEDAPEVAPPHERPVEASPPRIIAKAASFIRTVKTVNGPLAVVALESVASHPDLRGHGLGKLVVQRVLARVDPAVAPVCLFQTGAARGFYEKLGCRVVENPFIDSTHLAAPSARPWWDQVVMVYPADSPAWPEGLVDLLGPAW